MVNSLNDWFRCAIGAVFFALGVGMCFQSGDKLFIQIGSKRAPSGTKLTQQTVPRLVAGCSTIKSKNTK